MRALALSFGLVGLFMLCLHGPAAAREKAKACRDFKHGEMLDLRAARDNILFNRDRRGHRISAGFDRAVWLIGKYHWRDALPVLDGIADSPTDAAMFAGLDVSAARLAVFIRRCAAGWPSTPPGVPAKFYRVSVAGHSQLGRPVFIRSMKV